jgi:pyruvate dehydrogenase E2 component (dihydrolipoamide acetyltransferase)
MAIEIFIAKMSDHMEVGEIIRWLVQEGEQVNEGQVILEVETDKVAAEVVAEGSGVLKGIRPGAVAGAIVAVGETIAFITEPDEEVRTLPPIEPIGPAVAEGSTPPPPPTPNPEPAIGRPGRIRATPVARRVARELGVDIGEIHGSGPGGRIKEADVRAFAATTAAAPSPLAVKETVEWLALTSIQRLTGQRMLESVQQAPQFVLETDVDMTQTLWLRNALMERVLKETGSRLTITAILVKVAAEALIGHPRVNASFEDGRLKVFQQVNIGVAMGTDDGLVVPVVKEAGNKPLVQVVQELKSFKERARNNRFSIEDLSGGTFTISNLGMFEVTRFTAIINPPQSAILAVGKVIKTPVGMPDDTIALRPLMNLTLTIDHRSLDGVQAAKFLTGIKQHLEEPFFLL